MRRAARKKNVVMATTCEFGNMAKTIRCDMALSGLICGQTWEWCPEHLYKEMHVDERACKFCEKHAGGISCKFCEKHDGSDQKYRYLRSTRSK